MSFSRFDSCAQPRASTAWIRTLACALAAVLAGPTARAKPPALAATSPSGASRLNEFIEPLPTLEHAGDPSAYQRVTVLAVEEWDAGRWAEARALFLLAHGLRPSARTLRAVGKTAYELRLYPEAVRELSAALTDPRQPLDPAMRSEVRTLLQHADAFVSRFHIVLEPIEAHLRVDGGTPVLEPDGSVLLALGKHQLEIEASGYVTERHEIVVADSGEQTLTFRLSPDVKPAPSPPSTSPNRGESELRYHASSLSTAGAAVALGATSLALSLRAVREDERFERACNDCSPESGLSQKRDALVHASSALLGAASICAVTSVVLFFVERRRWKRDRESTPAGNAARRPRPHFGLGAVGLRF
jgi:hypothetical protein